MLDGVRPGQTNDEIQARQGVWGKTEWVPIAFLKHLREYTRTDRIARAKVDQIKANILANGWTDPVIITIGKQTSTAQLSEGNHRLQAAEELGWTEIPARCWVQTDTHKHDQFLSREPVKLPMKPKPDEYFSADAKPSQVFYDFK